MGEHTTKGLKSDNVYTKSFLLEAADALCFERAEDERIPSAGFEVLLADVEFIQRVEELEQAVASHLSGGFARIGSYPPSAYMTQLAVRVLQRRRSPLLNALAGDVITWAWGELSRQLALILAKSKLADYFQLGYCVALLASFNEPGRGSPEQRLLIDTALDQIFQAQLSDGTWSRSAPIFDLPGSGSTYCYEPEMLTELLSERNLEEQILRYLPQLQKTYDWLLRVAYQMEDDSLAWTSGHRQNQGPESWATAACYHFIHSFERLTSEAIRRTVFEYLRAPYVRPSSPKTEASEFAPRLLDSEVDIGSEKLSLRTVLFDQLVEPVARYADQVTAGNAIPAEVPNTVIFFGPPGTSKTELTRAIANYLNWPRLTLDPSHFVRKGIDRVSAEADLLFNMLEAMDRAVVLLDEIDELVRDRAAAQEALSRFLTTSMLPKLAGINRSRHIIFVVATNHIEQFDIAISRPGRFDLIMQVMPPTVDEKLRRFPDLNRHFAQIVADDATRREQLNQLTFDETARLDARLRDDTPRGVALSYLDEEFKSCTLNTAVDRLKDPVTTWKAVSDQHRNRIRVPSHRPSGDRA